LHELDRTMALLSLLSIARGTMVLPNFRVVCKSGAMTSNVLMLGAAVAPLVPAQSGLPPPQAPSFDGWLQDLFS